MVGERVAFEARRKAGEDEWGGPLFEAERAEVDGVLVAPGPCADLDATRPEGARVDFTLYVPKSFPGPVEGGRALVRGEWLDVVGHAEAYADADCPTRWHMVVEVGGAHG